MPLQNLADHYSIYILRVFLFFASISDYFYDSFIMNYINKFNFLASGRIIVASYHPIDLVPELSF